MNFQHFTIEEIRRFYRSATTTTFDLDADEVARRNKLADEAEAELRARGAWGSRGHAGS